MKATSMFEITEMTELDKQVYEVVADGYPQGKFIIVEVTEWQYYEEWRLRQKQHMDDKSIQTIEEIVGVPDYAVVFSLWPWPDGGWYAGCVLIDKDWATHQGLAAAGLPEYTGKIGDISWNVLDGFAEGVNAHESTPDKAIELLYSMLKTLKDLGEQNG